MSIRKVFSYLGVKSITAEEYTILKNEELPLRDKIVDNLYRYFECYSNLSMVILLHMACKLFLAYQEIFTPYKTYISTLCLVIVLFSLLRAAYQCYRKYMERMRILFSNSWKGKVLIMCHGGDAPISKRPIKKDKRKDKKDKVLKKKIKKSWSLSYR